MKHCHGCNNDKPVEEFNRSKDRKDGCATQCRICTTARNREWYRKNKSRKDRKNRDWYHNNKERSRNNHLKYKFGITLDDYNEILQEQGGVCALCEKEESAKDGRSGIVRSLAVDHCHETGEVRGLLCYRCNHLIGCLGDTMDSIQKVLDYMQLKGGSLNG